MYMCKHPPTATTPLSRAGYDWQMHHELALGVMVRFILAASPATPLGCAGALKPKPVRGLGFCVHACVCMGRGEGRERVCEYEESVAAAAAAAAIILHSSLACVCVCVCVCVYMGPQKQIDAASKSGYDTRTHNM